MLNQFSMSLMDKYLSTTNEKTVYALLVRISAKIREHENKIHDAANTT